jgi:eukaryotic-like serine/threonine-protein kinase
MSLAAGSKLGPYEILALIGAGGMGEVYRARDPRMGRDVAIKVSAERFSDRFSREVHAVAALNHPNICHLYDVGSNYLVMELVEGEPPKGPMPLDEALRFAKQIAEALGAAHEKGIVHRDLKPANIKIKPDGMVKVLDFGLAKIVEPADAAPRSDNSPTLTLDAATRVGVILGTAAYMPPEQARGKPVDKRADIWAFGVVLYEMLTGERLFDGETLSDTLIEVATKEPNWELVPFEVRRLLKKCLEKDPKKRLRDIGDAWALLDSPVGQVSDLPISEPRPKRAVYALAALAAALTLALAALAFVHFREKPPAAPIQRFQIAAPAGTSPSAPALSPDGSRLLFLAAGANGTTLLWVRPLDSLEAHPLPGTEGVVGNPFWSPDSRYIGFSAGRKLKKIDAAGGSAQVLCDTYGAIGGFWTSDGKIVFSGMRTNGLPDLLEVPETSGTPSPLPGVEHPANEYSVLPVLLPDGRHFVYTRGSGGGFPAAYLGSLNAKPGDTKQAQQNSLKLLTNAAPIAFEPSPDDPGLGYLLVLRDATFPGPVMGSVMAQPFDLRKLEPTGEPVLLAVQVSSYSASRTGILVYQTGPGTGVDQLTLFDAKGNAVQTIGEPGRYGRMFFSPDGTHIAADRSDQNPATLWMFDLTRGLGTRFISDPAGSEFPAWSPDGSRVAFMSPRGGKQNLYQRLSNGGGEDELLLKSDQRKIPIVWSRDGRFLVIGEGGGVDATASVLRFDGQGHAAGEPLLFVRKGLGMDDQFSPDPVGPPHWMAYQSNRSGRYEIYLLPFDPNSPTGAPPTAGEWQVSTGGGSVPRWNPNGKELFFLAPDGTLMAADLTGNPNSPTGLPKPLFKPKGLSAAVVNWDISPDGKKFLFPVPVAASTAAPPFTVILNWTALLKK